MDSSAPMQPIAYFNDRYVPAEELRLPVSDTGFMLGVTIAEQLRTFSGQPFRVQQHLARWRDGLRTVGLAELAEDCDFAAILQRVAEHNRQLLQPADDLGITLFATPGPYRTYAPAADLRPTVAAHTYPLPFRLWYRQYQLGQPLVVVDVQQVSPRCWPSEIKCRSRMHYFLADREARQQDAQATAILLDESGCISETPIANIVAYFAHKGLVSPPHHKILPGISLQVVDELARQLGLPFTYRDIRPDELLAADEIILTSTPYGLLPANRVNQQTIGQGPAGPIYQQLLQSWNRSVGINLEKQARQFADR
jgi:branched-subunit amino acid aminotransferase/4-amino-4-deoxychorismate lyase